MSSLTSRLELEPVTVGTGDNEAVAYIHSCNHVEWWPTNPAYIEAEGEISEQGCDACESGCRGEWRKLYARPE